ncbi:MAG: hypothetical protein MUC53_00165 [Candidatus Contendobacter sp.]|nr:hypothetical protein [Candidatus Contendobacter sp.]
MNSTHNQIKAALRDVDYRLPIGEYGRLVMWIDTSGGIRARIDEESRRDAAYVVRLESKLDNTEGKLSARGAVRALLEAEPEIRRQLEDDADRDETAAAIVAIDRERREAMERNRRPMPGWQKR